MLRADIPVCAIDPVCSGLLIALLNKPSENILTLKMFNSLKAIKMDRNLSEIKQIVCKKTPNFNITVLSALYCENFSLFCVVMVGVVASVVPQNTATTTTITTTTNNNNKLLFISSNKVLVGKPEGRKPLGRPRRRWVDNIRMDLQEVGCGYIDWIGLA